MISLIRIEDAAKWAAPLMGVLSACGRYHQAIHGRIATRKDVDALLHSIPPGRTGDDKFVYAILMDHAPVGCADVIRGYPDSRTAFVGLLAIIETHQRRGLGSTAYYRLEEEIAAWEGIKRIRLAVAETNSAVISFWESVGFARTGEVNPHMTERGSTTCIMLDKKVLQSRSEKPLVY